MCKNELRALKRKYSTYFYYLEDYAEKYYTTFSIFFRGLTPITATILFPFKYSLQVFAGVGVFIVCNVFRCAFSNEVASAHTAFWTKVQDVVR